MASTASAAPTVKHPVYRDVVRPLRPARRTLRISTGLIPAKAPIETREVRDPISSTGRKSRSTPSPADRQPKPAARRFPHPAALRDGWGPSMPPPMENAKANRARYPKAACLHRQTAALRPKSPISSSLGARFRPACPRGRTTRRGTQRSRWRRAARRRTARA